MTNFIENSVFLGAVLSLVAYEAGMLLKRKFKLAIFNPLLIAILCVMGVLSLLGIDYDTYNEGGKIYQLSSDPGNGVSGSAVIPSDESSEEEYQGCGSWDCFRCTGKPCKCTCFGMVIRAFS